MGKLLNNDVFIKIISVLIALMLWLYVMSEQNPSITRPFANVPVNPVNLDTSKLALMDDSNKLSVNVKIRSRRSIASQVKISDINASVDLRGRVEGENLIPVSVKVPENIEVIDVIPREIMVNLDAIVEKQVPVNVSLIGNAGEGYTAMEPMVKPREILVKGPRSIIKTVNTALVSLDLKNTTGSITASFPIKIVDAFGKEVKDIAFRPDIVEVNAPVVPYKTLTVEPSLTGNQAPGFTITGLAVEPSTVDVTGSESRLRDLNTISTENINISGATAIKRVTVNLDPPAGIAIIDQQNTAINVTVNIEKEVTRRLEFRTGVTVLNLPDNLVSEWEPLDFKIEFAAPQSIVDRLRPEDIRLTADASGITEAGSYTLDVKVEVPKPYRLTGLQPATVQIELKSI